MSVLCLLGWRSEASAFLWSCVIPCRPKADPSRAKRCENRAAPTGLGLISHFTQHSACGSMLG